MTAALLLLALACKPSPAPEAVLWSGEDLRVPLDHSALADLELGALSLFAERVEGPVAERPNAAHRGSYAVGNGYAFALMGLTDPLNTLHSAVGPAYDRGDHFFGDLGMVLRVDGELRDFDREWLSQVRGAPVSVTRGDVGDNVLYTVDLAPIPASGPVPAAILRWLAVQPGAEGQALEVCVTSYQPLALQEGVPMWAQGGGRSLALSGDWAERDGAWCLDLGSPTEPVMLPVLFVFAEDPQTAAAAAQVDDATARAWTADTLAHWADFSATGVQLSSPDQRIEDLYAGLRTSVRVQQTAAGGISPMSRYTGVWLRDTIGPVRFFSRAGLFDEAREMLDYLYLCHQDRGDFGNACASDLPADAVLPDPDWANLPPLAGRTAAEGPSYVPLAWTTWARWSGDWTPIADHWPYLSRAVLAQQMDEQGRQTWSGDETFRIAMNVAFGLELEVPWQDIAWSSNSSLLMAAASDAMADAAGRVGEDAAPFEASAALARHALDTTFTQPEGHIAAAQYYDGTPEGRPYEDVLLKMLWLPVYDVDDPRVLRAVGSLRTYAQPAPGAFQSPMDPRYQDNNLLGGATQGYGTGMTPGYSLFALNKLGAADTEAAFNWLPYYADAGGQYSEGAIWDDGSAVQSGYDPGGLLGDFAARYRPWEGGIVGDALLAYLVGAEPTPDGLRLRPHLPNGLPWLDVEQVSARDQVVDLRLEQDRSGLRATITARTAATVSLELPVPAWMADDALRYDGEERLLPGGERLIVYPAVTLRAGEAWSAAVDR